MCRLFSCGKHEIYTGKLINYKESQDYFNFVKT